MTRRACCLGLAALATVAGCIATSPEEERAEQEWNVCRAAPHVGGDDDDEGPEHCAGGACLACHSEDHNPGGKIFALAGTVYLRASDRVGLEGAQVIMTDSAGHEFTALTNRAGNFMVQVKGDRVEQDDHGRVKIPWQPTFPVWTRVRYGQEEEDMETRIWREGSCSACHTGHVGAASVSRVYLIEETP